MSNSYRRYKLYFKDSEKCSIIPNYFLQVGKAFSEVHNGLPDLVKLCPVPYEREKAHTKAYQESFTKV